jgi:hypothetical protein
MPLCRPQLLFTSDRCGMLQTHKWRQSRPTFFTSSGSVYCYWPLRIHRLLLYIGIDPPTLKLYILWSSKLNRTNWLHSRMFWNRNLNFLRDRERVLYTSWCCNLYLRLMVMCELPLLYLIHALDIAVEWVALLLHIWVILGTEVGIEVGCIQFDMFLLLDRIECCGLDWSGSG